MSTTDYNGNVKDEFFNLQYQVKLVQYSGPLDLLLQLIERSQLEITQIDLAQVTSQYVRHLSQLPDLEPAELNWFVDLATKLMHLKSSALLPTTQVDEVEAELKDLTRQLEEFGRYQLAASHLAERLSSNQQSWERSIAPTLPIDKLPMPPLAWEQLEEAFRYSMAQLSPPKPTKLLSKKSISLSEMVARVKASLARAKSTMLSQLLGNCSTQPEVIVLFLALLDLTRHGFIIVAQADQFDDITLTLSGQYAAKA